MLQRTMRDDLSGAKWGKYPVDKSPKVYAQLAREGVVLTLDSDNI